MKGARIAPTPFGKIMWAYALLVTAVGLVIVVAIQNG